MKGILPSLLPSDAPLHQNLQAYRPDLAAYVTDQGEPPFRSAQIYEHLMTHPHRPFSLATALPASLRDRLEDLGTSLLLQMGRKDDHEGTTKLLLTTSDDLLLETVVMRYPERTTVCVSTQIGCPLRCAFCSTGAMGFRRDLAAGEIVDQVRAAQVLLQEEDRRVTNVVFMGMGEPLLNLNATLTSLRLLLDHRGLDFARRSVSVSTVGIPEGIAALAAAEPQVNLALSLHAPADDLRSRLVPANRQYPLSPVMEAARDHVRRTNRKLMVEYVLLAGVNDSLRQAGRLVRLLQGISAGVNLLPCNPGTGGFFPSSAAAARSFQQVLEKGGVPTTLRTARGRDIAAGCGQLAAAGGEKTARGEDP